MYHVSQDYLGSTTAAKSALACLYKTFQLKYLAGKKCGTTLFLYKMSFNYVLINTGNA